MGQTWFGKRGDLEFGPWTVQQLREAAASGVLRPDDRLRTAERDKWVRAGDVKGLTFGSVVKRPARPDGSSPHRPTTAEPPPLPAKSGQRPPPLTASHQNHDHRSPDERGRVRRSPPMRWVIGGAAALLVGSIGLGVLAVKLGPKHDGVGPNEQPTSAPTGGDSGESTVGYLNRPTWSHRRLTYSVDDLEVCRNEKFILCGGRLHRFPDGQPVPLTLPDEQEPLYAHAFSPDGSKVAALRRHVQNGKFGTQEVRQEVIVYNLDGHAPDIEKAIRLRPFEPPNVGEKLWKRVAWSGDGGRLLLASEHWEAEVTSVEYATGTQSPSNAKFVQGDDLNTRLLSLSPDGKHAVLLLGGIGVCVYKTADMLMLRNLDPVGKGESRTYYQAGFSSDGRYFVAVGSETTSIWECTGWTLIRSFRPGGAVGRFGGFLGTGEGYMTQASQDDRHRLCVVDTASGEVRTAFEPKLPAAGFEATTCPSARSVLLKAQKASDFPLQVWDAQSGRLMVQLDDDRKRSATARYEGLSPSGRYVLTGYLDGELRVWDLTTAEAGSRNSVDTAVAKAQGETDESRANRQREAPPLIRAVYNRLRIGMLPADVPDIVKGRPVKEDSTRIPTDPSSNWRFRITQHYRAVGKPSATVILVYETPEEGGALRLARKLEEGLED